MKDLEAELIEKGFIKVGPIQESEFGEQIRSILALNTEYVHILHVNGSSSHGVPYHGPFVIYYSQPAPTPEPTPSNDN